jgi:hypothetical protein
MNQFVGEYIKVVFQQVKNYHFRKMSSPTGPEALLSYLLLWSCFSFPSLKERIPLFSRHNSDMTESKASLNVSVH